MDMTPDPDAQQYNVCLQYFWFLFSIYVLYSTGLFTLRFYLNHLVDLYHLVDLNDSVDLYHLVDLKPFGWPQPFVWPLPGRWRVKQPGQTWPQGAGTLSLCPPPLGARDQNCQNNLSRLSHVKHNKHKLISR